MTEVYKKLPDGSYEKMGYDWSGWPADGIWEVQDARQSLLVRRDDIPMMSPFLPALKGKEDECTDYIIESLETAGRETYNYRQISALAADFYGSLITKKDFPEAFL